MCIKIFPGFAEPPYLGGGLLRDGWYLWNQIVWITCWWKPTKAIDFLRRSGSGTKVDNRLWRWLLWRRWGRGQRHTQRGICISTFCISLLCTSTLCKIQKRESFATKSILQNRKLSYEALKWRSNFQWKKKRKSIQSGGRGICRKIDFFKNHLATC